MRIDEALEARAWAILESHADKRWSHVDATSFALVEREQITEAFAFDRHFAQRGLTVMPALRVGDQCRRLDRTHESDITDT
ncbi:MAG TPA: hypothetical protein VNV37_12865 [Solirubrobacteraceae bacterium]|nr:hypothetical protein [Solirubrobacteraceae bacterium]